MVDIAEQKGTVSVRKLISVSELAEIIGCSESLIRHNRNKFYHLEVKLPVRSIAYDAFKVNLAIQNGDLSK